MQHIVELEQLIELHKTNGNKVISWQLFVYNKCKSMYESGARFIVTKNGSIWWDLRAEKFNDKRKPNEYNIT